MRCEVGARCHRPGMVVPPTLAPANSVCQRSCLLACAAEAHRAAETGAAVVEEDLVDGTTVSDHDIEAVRASVAEVVSETLRAHLPARKEVLAARRATGAEQPRELVRILRNREEPRLDRNASGVHRAANSTTRAPGRV